MQEHITETVFYSIEKTIKTYRKFAQRRLDNAGIDITIDQWLIIKCMNDNPEISQIKLAELTFKEVASVTRMLDLLVKKGFVVRMFNETDRRRFSLKITPSGNKVLSEASVIVSGNRAMALNGIDKTKITELQQYLNMIFDNCENQLG